MHLVDQATHWPHHCAVIPFKGNSNARGGFIDTGIELEGRDPHVYICMESAIEIAKFIGWAGPSERRELQSQISALEAENERLRTENEEQGRFIDSVEYIGRGPMKPYKKSGRPPKQKEKVAS